MEQLCVEAEQLHDHAEPMGQDRDAHAEVVTSFHRGGDLGERLDRSPRFRERLTQDIGLGAFVLPTQDPAQRDSGVLADTGDQVHLARRL